jgi:hypothetical protein
MRRERVELAAVVHHALEPADLDALRSLLGSL